MAAKLPTELCLQKNKAMGGTRVTDHGDWPNFI